jgi:hypothetical protein
MSAALGRLRRIFNLLLITIHGAVEPIERTPSIHPKSHRCSRAVDAQPHRVTS